MNDGPGDSSEYAKADPQSYPPNTVLKLDLWRDRGRENLEKAQEPLTGGVDGGARSPDESPVPDTASKRPMQGAPD